MLKLKARIAWYEKTYNKMDEIFRQNNQDNVPDWLDGFLDDLQVQKVKDQIIEKGLSYQGEFEKLIKAERPKEGDHTLEK